MSTPSVLFLCVHNAGRSQMAAAFARELGGERVTVYSGGSAPGEQVNPAAVEVMAELDIDISDEQPQRWTDEIARSVDVIITMGCGDECPLYPGVRMVDWELQDPAGKPPEFVRVVRDDIRQRVQELLGELGVAS
ncbi:MAG: arsenate reductase ArsC [Actinomycetota bacterium]